ncbi:hypothetical protein BB559_004270 [Furculomyces boomerangus]|uniref:Alpha N-terminal protein methyltransferase 1 n=2 Tax=Harpellales TaxID=61421 RepID=A0A2T9Y2K0_9FUNG|nr:hypothetical protein BB559_006503 [Furculomyces boomerangus]PVU91142.1 hypothetical protein BB559_004270 [Furculomyces boomerangus]PWA01476.1 hypothetical protein BB558_002429 [Smittium angustum]
MIQKTFTKTETWYQDADDYWNKVGADENGMLGGLKIVHGPDIRDSKQFLKAALKHHNIITSEQETSGNVIDNGLYVLDCGAGIGRVSKFLLSEFFSKIDIVEQNAKFVETAKNNYLSDLIDRGQVINLYVSGLQEFEFCTPDDSNSDHPESSNGNLQEINTTKNKIYDVIWCQWVLSHLADEDLVSFLIKCKTGLSPNGIIFVKENVCSFNYVVDKQDSSVTRSSVIFESLFEKAGMKIIIQKVQHGFPRDLFKVRMWALAPK